MKFFDGPRWRGDFHAFATRSMRVKFGFRARLKLANKRRYFIPLPRQLEHTRAMKRRI